MPRCLPRPFRAVDPAARTVLAGWEKAAAGVTNLRTEISVKRTDAVSKKETNFTGVVVWMKPNFVLLRMENAGDPSKTDYKAYIYNGQSVFAYNGLQKRITEIKIPAERLRSDPQPFDGLNPLKAADVKERFDVTLLKTDEYYVYLDLKPRIESDKREFRHIRLALYGPGPATEKLAYLPAQVQAIRPGGDAEMWKFSKVQVNIPGVTEANFRFEPVKGWEVIKWSPIPAAQP